MKSLQECGAGDAMQINLLTDATKPGNEARMGSRPAIPDFSTLGEGACSLDFADVSTSDDRGERTCDYEDKGGQDRHRSLLDLHENGFTCCHFCAEGGQHSHHGSAAVGQFRHQAREASGLCTPMPMYLDIYVTKEKYQDLCNAIVSVFSSSVMLKLTKRQDAHVWPPAWLEVFA